MRSGLPNLEHWILALLAVLLHGASSELYSRSNDLVEFTQKSGIDKPVAPNGQNRNIQSPSQDKDDLAEERADRIWLLSTRKLTSRATQVEFDRPEFNISLLNAENVFQPKSFDTFMELVTARRKAVIYVHGNRFTAEDAITRGRWVQSKVSMHELDQPIDWIIWSWESDKNGILVHDARIKASRTEGQGLYLGWLLRKYAEKNVPTTLVGYSFGGRVVTGALHAAAGGELGGVSIQGEPTLGAPFNAALIAPAIDSLWLSQRGYHRNATQNLDQLTLFYNRRDAILKRYWLIDRVQGRLALGYTGPRSFAPRFDGTSLPVLSRDCSDSIGLKHDELFYFQKSCDAGHEIAKLINQLPTAK